MDESIRDSIQRLPEAIEPPLVTEEPNTAHQIYDGLLRLNLAGRQHLIRGTLRQEWLPEPTVRFSGLIESDQILSLSTGEGTLEVDEHLPEAPVLITRVDHDLGKESRISGFLNGRAHWDMPSSRRFSSLRFGLTNFHSYIGEPVRKNGGFSRIRLSFESEDWAITVDGVQNQKEIKKRLDGVGGYIVSHAGKLEKKSGDITAEDVEEMQSALAFYFALLRGFWCGPVWLSAPGEHGKSYALLSPLLLSRWESVRSWFPDKTAPDLSASFDGFMNLWNDAEWNEPLRHAIWWYLEANERRSQESSVVMAQTALELLGWVVLVEQFEMLSADGFEKLPAADKIRLLLGKFRIPLAIDGLVELKGFGAAYGGYDGPGAFTLMRNAIVHPNKKKRGQLAQAARNAKWEAAQMGLQYLELVLLALVGYSGQYRDRTDVQRMAIRPVPWAAESR